MSQPEAEDPYEEEVAAAERVVNDIRNYLPDVKRRIHQRQSVIKKLKPEDQALLSDETELSEVILKNARENQHLLNEILQFSQLSMGEDSPLAIALRIHQMRRSPCERIAKVRTLLKQVVRDWSAEGVAERESCYGRAFRGLLEAFPDASTRDKITVLVPGSGVGRLAWEICQAGFSTMANEFDFLMLTAANFMLNAQLPKNILKVYPYLAETCNNWTAKDQLRAISIPDVDMSAQTVANRTNTFGCAMGDFLEIFPEENQFDAVVSVFFLDTAKNLIDYIRRTWAILKPGGVWINFGPLTYHYVDMNDVDSLELPYDQVLEIIQKVGFKVTVNETNNPPAYYAHNPKSMMNFAYNCGYFECVKYVST